MEELTSSGNINEKWLQNIYENIKKLEQYERLVREGCSSVFDYLQIPIKQRDSILGLTQYKNLRFFLTEFNLLLADLSPVIEKEKIKGYEKTIKKIEGAIKNKSLFVDSIYSVDKQLINSNPTEFFYITIDILHELKINLFKDIKHILYINTEHR